MDVKVTHSLSEDRTTSGGSDQNPTIVMKGLLHENQSLKPRSGFSTDSLKRKHETDDHLDVKRQRVIEQDELQMSSVETEFVNTVSQDLLNFHSSSFVEELTCTFYKQHPVPSWAYTIKENIDTDLEGIVSDEEGRVNLTEQNRASVPLSLNWRHETHLPAQLVSTEQKSTPPKTQTSSQVNENMSEEVSNVTDAGFPHVNENLSGKGSSATNSSDSRVFSINAPQKKLTYRDKLSLTEQNKTSAALNLNRGHETHLPSQLVSTEQKSTPPKTQTSSQVNENMSEEVSNVPDAGFPHVNENLSGKGSSATNSSDSRVFSINASQKKLTYGDELTIPHIEKIDRPIFRNCEFRCHFKFEHLEDFGSFAKIYDVIHRTHKRVFDIMVEELNPDDYVQIELRADALNEPIIVNQRVDEIDADEFLNKAADALQGTKDILSSDALYFVMNTVGNLRGGIHKPRKIGTVYSDDFVRSKRRCLFIIPNKHSNLCFAATLLGLMDLENARFPQLIQEAEELHRRLNLSPQHMVSFSDIATFEKLLDVKVRVYYRGANLQEFETSTSYHPRSYFMYLQDNHYYGITNLKMFLGVPFLCDRCHKSTGTRNTHKCDTICKVCLIPECRFVGSEKVVCKDCYRICRSRLCYTNHKLPQMDPRLQKQNPSQCDSVKHCSECYGSVLTRSGKAHQCQGVSCPGCGEVNRAEKHRCCLSKLASEPLAKEYIFYDIECLTDCVPNYIYSLALDSQLEKEFYGDNCVAEFCEFFIRGRFQGYTFLAHNCRNYDSDLIMRYLARKFVIAEPVNQGSKVIGFNMKDLKIRFVNSYTFIPIKLRAIPKAMGLEMAKGYFPHFFNTSKNQRYAGLMPPIHYFGEQIVTAVDNNTFLGWYEAHKDRKFVLSDELEVYCKNNVHILREAFSQFRDEVFKEGGIDPFKYATPGQACMAAFRTNFIPKNKIAVVPRDNYRGEFKRNQTASIQWLEYLSVSEGVIIQHALNSGEKLIGPYFVDGFATKSDGDVCYVFCWCSSHGCPQCFPVDVKRNREVPYSSRYKDLQKKLSYLKDRNLQVQIIWEHKWADMKKDPKVRAIVRKKCPEPFDPCRALYGGQTNAICLAYKTQPEEKIHYYALNGLYPSLYKTQTFPVGHPVVIRETIADIKEYFGLAKATVYPPRKLLFPVLPLHIGGKLIFTLCRTCAETTQQATACTHEDESRALTGIWCTVEIEKALEQGYRIGKVFEVWHFAKRSNGIFKKYINTQLKHKQEALGYPSWCDTDEKQEKYVRDCHEKGVMLDKDKIKLNPVRSQVSEFFLNSLWGEFGNRPLTSRSTAISKPEEFDKLLFSEHFKVLNLNFVQDNLAFVKWCYDSDHRKSPGNVFIAAFASAYARLQQYGLLKRLQERCLYIDTDLVVFVSRPGDWEPPLGDQLGEFTSRLSAGDYIVEFVSVARKTYGYKTFMGKACMKVKGIALNEASADEVDIDSLKYLVRKKDATLINQEPVVTDSSAVKENGHERLKDNTPNSSHCITYNSRVLNSDYTTLPYGF
ncbi:uncharacterized protein LOC117402631 [Acipenser ruthenus]|uniref:uncharacterized protein LOC117402631 n=1 Tax=Acipenser ruthenus TaxID=7906 RepID=UPI0027414B40|nr:uncharacterized protein LOC117402631 [Acipenser ruthenus]